MRNEKNRQGQVDLSDVTLRASEKAAAAVHMGTQEAVEKALASEGTYVDLPALWGYVDRQGRTEEALALEIGIDIGDASSDVPTYTVSLRDVLAEYMTSCRDDGLFVEGLGKVELALRELADDIRDAVEHRGSGAK